VAIADFNGDGVPDLVLPMGVPNSLGTNGTAVAAYWLEGAGNGTFKLAAQPLGVDSPFAMVAADFNGDGKPDLAILTIDSSADTASMVIALGQGDGTFRIANTYPASVLYGITVADETAFPISSYRAPPAFSARVAALGLPSISAKAMEASRLARISAPRCRVGLCSPSRWRILPARAARTWWRPNGPGKEQPALPPPWSPSPRTGTGRSAARLRSRLLAAQFPSHSPPPISTATAGRIWLSPPCLSPGPISTFPA
jgi:hypothetical protein